MMRKTYLVRRKIVFVACFIIHVNAASSNFSWKRPGDVMGIVWDKVWEILLNN